MKILVYMPIDTIVRTWARFLEADGHAVETTHTFSVFRRRVGWADWTLLNATKSDAPRYVWKILFSLVYARLRRRRVAVFLSIDMVDLCDRPVLRAALWSINWLALRCAALVILLAPRAHVAHRYGLAKSRVLLVHNAPDPAVFIPVERRPDAVGERPVTFLYHGELLWWHGLERFVPIYEEVKKRRPARLVVTGNFYPTSFRLFGLLASRREAAIKRALEALLERDDVEYLGRVSIERLLALAGEAHFHVSLLNDEDAQARTEQRTCLLEAMAMGMACLHAPMPALAPEVFRDGENIVLVDPRDPAAAADKIVALVESPERLAPIGQQAIETVAEHFDMRAEYEKALARLGE
jgi:glycosyltransferase involved in cell wall biosynthesis